MKTYLIICVLYSLINTLSSLPAGSPSITSVQDHKNIKLLPVKGVCGKNGFLDKLFGGEKTSIYEFPWLALLRYKKLGQWTNTLCAGDLINEKYVLTAAHCVNASAAGDVAAVRLGEYDLDKEEDCDIYPDDDNVCSDKPIEYEVEEIILHEDYNHDTNLNDIALIRLKETVKYTSFIKPICLPLNGEKTAEGEKLIASGWGLTEHGTQSSIKLKVKLPVFNQAMCKNVYSTMTTITDSHLCAGGQRGYDACRGDSGGPIMGTYPKSDIFYLEGIVSFGLPDCGKIRVPGVYTRMTYFVDWILDHIKP